MIFNKLALSPENLFLYYSDLKIVVFVFLLSWTDVYHKVAKSCFVAKRCVLNFGLVKRICG